MDSKKVGGNKSKMDLQFELYDQIVDMRGTFYIDEKGVEMQYEGLGIEVKKYSFHDFQDYLGSSANEFIENSCSTMQLDDLDNFKKYLNYCISENRKEQSKIILELETAKKIDTLEANQIIKFCNIMLRKFDKWFKENGLMKNFSNEDLSHLERISPGLADNIKNLNSDIIYWYSSNYNSKKKAQIKTKIKDRVVDIFNKIPIEEQSTKRQFIRDIFPFITHNEYNQKTNEKWTDNDLIKMVEKKTQKY